MASALSRVQIRAAAAVLVAFPNPWPLPKSPRKRPTRAKPSYDDDPYVPISPTVLRAIMTELEVPVMRLARESSTSQQNIDNILASSEGRLTRQSRRSQIANALGVLPEMLSGESPFLPTGSRSGYELGYSARTRFAAYRLLTKCQAAARRDVQRLSMGDHNAQAHSIPRLIESLVADLLAVGSWRERLLRFTPARHPRQGYREPLSSDAGRDGRPVDDPAHEAGTVALIRALEHILTPWFDGIAALDYATLNEMTTSQSPTHSPEREDPRAVLKGIWLEPSENHAPHE